MASSFQVFPGIPIGGEGPDAGDDASIQTPFDEPIEGAGGEEAGTFWEVQETPNPGSNDTPSGAIAAGAEGAASSSADDVSGAPAAPPATPTKSTERNSAVHPKGPRIPSPVDQKGSSVSANRSTLQRSAAAGLSSSFSASNTVLNGRSRALASPPITTSVSAQSTPSSAPPKQPPPGTASAPGGKRGGWGLLDILKPLQAAVGAARRSAAGGTGSTASSTVTSPSADGKAPSATRYTYTDFLDKIRDTSARPLARRLGHFIRGCCERAESGAVDMASVHAFVTDFHGQVAAHALWRGAPPAELDNAFESIEKCILLKRQLYGHLFRGDAGDRSADEALSEKIFLHQFITPEHLDIRPEFSDASVWAKAQQELRNVNEYRAPRDKIVCVLNCCKWILNHLQTVKHKRAAEAAEADGEPTDPAAQRKKVGLMPSADDFLPILIYLVLRARVPQLMLNIRYIELTRHPSRLAEEALYYFTNLKSAVAFVERLDADALSIQADEYEAGVAKAKAAWPAELRAMKKAEAERVLRRRRDAAARARRGTRASSTAMSEPPTPSGPADSASAAASAPATPATSVPAAATAALDTKVSEAGETEASNAITPPPSSKPAAATTTTPDSFRFYRSSAGSLRLADIPKLLSDYKLMAEALVAAQQKLGGQSENRIDLERFRLSPGEEERARRAISTASGRASAQSATRHSRQGSEFYASPPIARTGFPMLGLF